MFDVVERIELSTDAKRARLAELIQIENRFRQVFQRADRLNRQDIVEICTRERHLSETHVHVVDDTY